ncbi:HesA/MoeB/ThiF family protein [Oceanibacterium hippocampi]|uniref:Molybdopterin-synthase adenylyltransferase n=1 Tax=Oceanibacterium hippocampi TaxID=745714 RepID=A0A1Y5RNN4_9PROT|nr:molybdopterin-synthase adenylyltransferase MoeB [Oceanibacterium hippocampi]SLN21855.1 putative adenylyltransferase/sulfurtransferase MoeZ [Oceanibacterium hippocampi]
MAFTDDQLERYARHVILHEIGGAGQQRLLGASVLIVGAGGLGSPLVMYLAAAGVGRIGIVDDDTVSLSNLQRQIAHGTERIGMTKTASAGVTVASLNPDVELVGHTVRLDASNALDLVGAYDIVADGSDNPETRFLVNDACYLARRPLVSGAILRFDGQLTTFKAHEPGDNPCYRCLFPSPPPADVVPSCAEAGVLGALAGIIGSMQANEVIKEITGVGESLSGRLLIFDALATAFRTVRVRRDPACALCGEAATIRDLRAHAA